MMLKRSPLLFDLLDAPVDEPACLPARLSGCFFGGSSSKSSAQQTSAPVVNQQGLNMLNSNVQNAQNVVDTTFQPYAAPMTAGLDPNQQQAVGAAPGMLTAGLPQLAGAASTAGGLAGYTAPQAGATMAAPGLMSNIPQTAGPQAVDPGNIAAGMSQFMNPYTSQVVDATNNEINQQRQRALMGNAQTATADQAFGGTRQAVGDALTNQQYDMNTALIDSQLNQMGFNTALQGATSQAGNQLFANNANAGNQMATQQFNAGLLGDLGMFNAGNQQTTNLANAAAQNNMGQFNVGSNLASAGVQQNAANSLANIGGQAQNQYGNYLNALMGTGSMDQSTQQSYLTNLYNEFLRQQQYPFEGQQLVNQSLGLVPASLGQSSQGTSKSSASGFNMNLGGGLLYG